MLDYEHNFTKFIESIESCAPDISYERKSIVLWWIQLSSAMTASHLSYSSCPSCSTNDPSRWKLSEKAAEDESSAWAPDPRWETWLKCLAPSSSLSWFSSDCYCNLRLNQWMKDLSLGLYLQFPLFIFLLDVQSK